jgi:hypothetical protein
MSASIAHAQTGNPSTIRGTRFFFSTGLGRSDWHRQHILLSSGFQVPHFGQSMLPPFIEAANEGRAILTQT